ncbi:MAG: hypothetical protein ACREYF_13225 [Gammaproteobacteria bacterium]
MNANVINATVILSIIVGTYFIATALFHWSFAKHFDCPVRLLGLKHNETLPYVLVLMLFFGVASWFEVGINFKTELVKLLMVEFCLMLMSWTLFFRAVFDFKRISMPMFLRILLGVSLVAGLESISMDESEWKHWQSIIQQSHPIYEMLNDSISQTNKSAEILRDLAKEKIELLPSKIPILLPTWGDGSEKDLLEIYNWSREEEKRWLEYTPNSAVIVISLYLGVLMTWVIPMSVLAGRLYALPAVRTYETVEFLRNRQEQCKYLVAMTEQWLVLRGELSYPCSLEVIPTKDLSFRILPTDKLPLSLQLKNMGEALFCVWRDYRWEGR